MLSRRFLSRLVSAVVAAAGRKPAPTSSLQQIQHLGTVGGSQQQQESSADQSSGSSNRISSSNERPEFPGSRSQFTTELKFVDPNDYEPIPVFRVLDSAGNLVAAQFANYIDIDLAKRFQKEMIKLNQMDNILYQAQRQGRISFYMTTFGEEATHFGPAAALREEDLVFGQYRESGVLLWRGFGFADFINQCFGSHLDLGKGRQMPIHYGSRQLNYMTIKSSLGTGMPHSVGAAYAFKLMNKDRVTLCYFGDGAASEGDAHASFNFASVLNCPVIFLCRNNGYAISTPTSEQYKGDGIAARGPALGIPTIRVDGNDVFAMYFAVKEARRIAIEEGRPVLIEAMTYRISHHSTSDDSTAYRSVDEVRTWKEREHPLNRVEELLKRHGAFDEAATTSFKEAVRKEIIDIVAQAEKQLKPPINYLFTDVYDQMSVLQREQLAELTEHLEQYGEHYPVKNFKSDE